jgi:integrase
MLRTKSGLPKYCCWNTDHHGKRRRVRFRLRGFSTYLTGTPWSEDSMRQYATALDSIAAQAQDVGAARTKPGSIDALCVSYYRSPDFHKLKASTQRVRRNIIERFRIDYGSELLKELRPRHIDEIIGAKEKTPEAANNLLKVLKVMLDYAVRLEMIDRNPAAIVKRYRTRGEGIHPWTEEEIKQFRVHHSLGSRARLALELLLNSGQRKGDVIKMGWQHVHGEDIDVRQEKTDTPLLIPMHPELVRALASVARTNMTFLVTERGAAFSAASFGNWFRKRCDEAGLPQCSAHGLRHAQVTRLVNAGCSNEQIKAITGHRSDSSLAVYKRAGNQRLLARQALAMQLRQDGAEGEQNCPTTETRIVQPGSK